MKIQHNRQNKITFKADIKVVSSLFRLKEQIPLEKLRAAGNTVNYWGIYDAKFLEEGYTSGATVCTEGYIQNGKAGFMFHLDPGNDSNTEDTIAETFAKIIHRLKKQNNDISAFITGGHIYNKMSCDMYDLIKNVLEDLKVNFSSIWGYNKNGDKWTDYPFTDLFASAINQKYIINTNMDTLAEVEKMKHQPYKFNPKYTIKNINDLKNTYEEIIIASKDTLIFN